MRPGLFAKTRASLTFDRAVAPKSHHADHASEDDVPNDANVLWGASDVSTRSTSDDIIGI